MKKPLAVNATITLAALLSTAHAETLNVYGWAPGEASFDALVEPVEQALGVEFKYTGVPVKDYSANLEEMLIYGEDVDVMGLTAASTVRFFEAGWIEPLQGSKQLVALADSYYEQLSGALYYKNQLMGVSVGAVLCNFPVVDLGLYGTTAQRDSGLPSDWDSFYDQIVELAKTENAFYLPFWHASAGGMPVSFISEVLNRGGQVIEPESKQSAMSAKTGSAAYETLLDWRRAWQSGAIPSHILELNRPQFFQDFLENRYTFSNFCSDFLLNFKQHPLAAGRLLVPLPKAEQSWGSLQVGTYSIASTADDAKAKIASEFLYHFGKGEGNNRFSVARNYLEKVGILPAFPEYMNSLEVWQTLGRKLPRAADAKTLIDVYESAPYPSVVYNLQWYQEFESQLREELIRFLKNPDRSPEQVIKTLNKKIRNIRADFGYL